MCLCLYLYHSTSIPFSLSISISISASMSISMSIHIHIYKMLTPAPEPTCFFFLHQFHICHLLHIANHSSRNKQTQQHDKATHSLFWEPKAKKCPTFIIHACFLQSLCPHHACIMAPQVSPILLKQRTFPSTHSVSRQRHSAMRMCACYCTVIASSQPIHIGP